LENKAAAETEGPPPKKRRNEGSQAEDMSLVTSSNVRERKGWKVSSLGRITRPVKMRPERPLPDIRQESTLKKGQVRGVGMTEGEKNKIKKTKRLKDPDSRARRRTIDMTKWGSTHLKGMFLDMPTLGMKRLQFDDPAIESEDSEESGDDNDRLKVPQSSEQTVSSQTPLSPPLPANPLNISADISALSIKSQSSVLPLPENNVNLEVEKTQTLNFLASLFGGKDDNWVHPESVGSDIDVDELMKEDAMLVDDDDDDGVEVVPINNSHGSIPKTTEQENEQETGKPLPQVEASTKLKDLFAPREEEGR
jgi:hypothetical protein